MQDILFHRVQTHCHRRKHILCTFVGYQRLQTFLPSCIQRYILISRYQIVLLQGIWTSVLCDHECRDHKRWGPWDRGHNPLHSCSYIRWQRSQDWHSDVRKHSSDGCRHSFVGRVFRGFFINTDVKLTAIVWVRKISLWRANEIGRWRHCSCYPSKSDYCWSCVHLP